MRFTSPPSAIWPIWTNNTLTLQTTTKILQFCLYKLLQIQISKCKNRRLTFASKMGKTRSQDLEVTGQLFANCASWVHHPENHLFLIKFCPVECPLSLVSCAYPPAPNPLLFYLLFSQLATSAPTYRTTLGHLAGSSTNSLQEWYAFVTGSYSFERIFLHCSPIFSLKYAIDRAQRDLSIPYTKVGIGWLWRKILPKQ